MKNEFKPLFTPWKIGNVEIKNRIVLCPMGGTSLFGWMKPNGFNKEAGEFFLKRAKNNVGLIIPGIAPIKDLIGRRWLYENKKMFKSPHNPKVDSSSLSPATNDSKSLMTCLFFYIIKKVTKQ